MKKIALICLALSISALAGCGLLLMKTVTGSEEIAMVAPAAVPFTGVSVADGCQAVIAYGADYSVTVRINANFEEYLRLEVQAGTLQISLDPSINYRNLTFTAAITLPALETLSADDAAEAAVSGFTSAAALEFKATDASKITLSGIESPSVTMVAGDASGVTGSLVCGEAQITLTNAAGAALSGTAEKLTLTLDNACGAELALLETLNTTVKLTNASEARVCVTGGLSGSAANASHLHYTGNPLTVNVTTANASSVQPF